jgi:hypothetical protein
VGNSPPGNANLPIGGVPDANREIGVPRIQACDSCFVCADIISGLEGVAEILEPKGGLEPPTCRLRNGQFDPNSFVVNLTRSVLFGAFRAGLQRNLQCSLQCLLNLIYRSV